MALENLRSGEDDQAHLLLPGGPAQTGQTPRCHATSHHLQSSASVRRRKEDAPITSSSSWCSSTWGLRPSPPPQAPCAAWAQHLSASRPDLGDGLQPISFLPVSPGCKAIPRHLPGLTVKSKSDAPALATDLHHLHCSRPKVGRLPSTGSRLVSQRCLRSPSETESFSSPRVPCSWKSHVSPLLPLSPQGLNRTDELPWPERLRHPRGPCAERAPVCTGPWGL